MTEPDAPGCAPQTPLSGPVRAWFEAEFPAGPTPAQALAWPRIAAGEHLLLVAPTGTGKTLAGFLAILDKLYRQHADGTLKPGLRCVYVSPLRSLGYDVERNLSLPIEAIRLSLGLAESPVRVGVRTGDTSAYDRQKLRKKPPHLLITTPESLSILLSQKSWQAAWSTVEHLIVDEIHALAPSKRGADLMVSLERLAASSRVDPARVGLSATCRPTEVVARFLGGPTREVHVEEAPGFGGLRLDVESLMKPGEGTHRGLSYRRLLRRLHADIDENRTTVVFANTRAFAEKLTHDLRAKVEGGEQAVAAHHSALDADRRRAVEAALKAGTLRAVLTSTSLELGVDIGTADLSAMVGLPGSASRCLQRVGRAGHRPGVASRGVILAATPEEIAGGAVTAAAARAGRVEPIRPVEGPLDVLCQQLIGMAAADEWDVDEAFALVRKSAPMADLSRQDFDDCLCFLAGDLAAPAGAWEPEPGAEPRWTSPRLWRARGRFGVRNARVSRWLRGNIGTITAEESARVVVDGVSLGTLEGAYAERLQAGDRFLLDGRSLEFRRLEGLTVHARPSSGGEAELPRWTSDKQSISPELALDLARLRDDAATVLAAGGPEALGEHFAAHEGLTPAAAEVLAGWFAAQEQLSEIPRLGGVLVEAWPTAEGVTYAFHAPLPRNACEAVGRAVAARLGRALRRDIGLEVADLGWSIRISEGDAPTIEDIPALLSPDGFEADVLDGLDRGELLARRFRHVAGTALMVLRNPEGGRMKVGGLLWVSRRLYPLVLAACPGHPLLRETRREVLDGLLDARSARAWLESRPLARLRSLEGPSPFAASWAAGDGAEPLRFEAPGEALRRLHRRVTSGETQG